MIAFDLDDLPVHVATAVGGPTIHPEAPDNLAFDWAFGDEAAVAAAFAAAAHTTRLELVDNRVMAMPMEPRGCFAEWDGARLHLAFSGQGVWGLRDELARATGARQAAVRVTTPDVGGGFGMKASTYPEYFAVAFAARETGRPVRWMSTRSEAMLTDSDGRDHVTVAEAAFDADLKLQALRIDCVADLGAYNGALRPAHPVRAGAEGDAGGLRRAEDLLRGEGRLHQHRADGRLPRAPGGPRRST